MFGGFGDEDDVLSEYWGRSRRMDGGREDIVDDVD